MTTVQFDVTPIRERLIGACEADPVPLDRHDLPTGPGVYLLKHLGDHPLYRRFATRPVYVGRSASLRQRIRTHHRTFMATRDLDPTDFGIIAVSTEGRAIAALYEELLIEHYRPVWNQPTVGGFGNRYPGAKRSNQRTAPFDRLHPGRHWARGSTDPCLELTTWVAAYE